MNIENIFVVGNSRSGTTLLARSLNLHPKIFTFRELHFFEELHSGADMEQSLSAPAAEALFAKLIALQRDGYMLVKSLSATYIDEAKTWSRRSSSGGLSSIAVLSEFLKYESNRHGAEIACEQTPRNLFYVDQIFENFGRSARCIVMYRDPRDVLVSQKRKWRRKFLGMPQLPWHESLRSWINYHPITVSLLWKSAIREGNRHADRVRVKYVQFESLLQQPAVEMRSICDFLGVEYSQDMLHVSMRDSSSATDDALALGFDKSRISQWRTGGLRNAEIFLCEYLSGEEMQRLGYQRLVVHLGFWGWLWVVGYLATFPLKTIAALLANLHRMKHPVRAVAARISALSRR